MAVPAGCTLRPENTGWYADFDGRSYSFPALPPGTHRGGVLTMAAVLKDGRLHQFETLEEARRLYDYQS